MSTTTVAAGIRLMAEALPAGQSMRAQCPECGVAQMTFVVTRFQDGGLAYHCHRASCGFSGFVDNRRDPGSVRSAAAQEEPRFYRGSIEPLSGERLFYFQNRFGVSLNERPWVFENADGSFVMPIRNPYGATRGYGVRRGAWSHKDGAPTCPLPRVMPKFMSYKHEEGPLLSWYVPDKNVESLAGIAVLCEDQVSAMKCATRGCVGVALMGTDMDHAKVREIQRYTHPYDVVIALDEDATEKAFRLARTWGAGLRNCRVAILDEDLKDSESLLTVLGIR